MTEALIIQILKLAVEQGPAFFAKVKSVFTSSDDAELVAMFNGAMAKLKKNPEDYFGPRHGGESPQPEPLPPGEGVYFPRKWPSDPDDAELGNGDQVFQYPGTTGQFTVFSDEELRFFTKYTQQTIREEGLRLVRTVSKSG